MTNFEFDNDGNVEEDTDAQRFHWIAEPALSFYFFGTIDNEIARKLTSKEIDGEKEMTRNRESPSKKYRVSCDAAKAKYAHHKTHKIKRTETGYETLNIYIPSPVAFPARAVPAHE